MKKISCLGILAAVAITGTADARYSNKDFQREVLTGLDIVSARETVDVVADTAPGEMGREVYQTLPAPDPNIRMFIPTTMYIRAGGGINLNFATDKAEYFGNKYKTSDSYTTQIGLGWNLSSYVRTEIDFQESSFEFSHLHDAAATYQTIGTMLYFDLARRYVQTGDITRRRVFVPFIGVGAAVGQYRFEGTGGADGIAIAAPRATLGFNVMFNELVGIDVMYQYQMMIGNGFGWDVSSGVANISNIMASLRVNF